MNCQKPSKKNLKKCKKKIKNKIVNLNVILVNKDFPVRLNFLNIVKMKNIFSKNDI